MTATRGDDALALSHITKRFGSVLALDDVSLSVRRGSVHALVGENGAGKTTLMRIAFGLLAPDSGEIRVSGAPRPIRTTADAIAAGLGMVHQHFTNISAMTVAENVALGGHGSYSAAAAREQVATLGAQTGLAVDPDARAGDLPVGAQQRLEILKALARRARVLILDEPTAVLAPTEADELLRWLRAFAEEGNAVVLITHKLREALSVAHDVTVLRRGRTVLTAPAASLDERSLADALLGEPSAAGAATPRRVSGERRARVVFAEGLSLRDERGIITIREAAFSIDAGEMIGIAAVEGAGQRELLRALAGRIRPSHGTLALPERVGFIPEDRHRDALVQEFVLSENVALKGAGAGAGRMDWRAIDGRTDELIAAFDVRGGTRSSRADALSGGNQQKLVLARELDGDPPLIVAENPTRGLDIRATEAVHERLGAACADGAAVVVYSSDLDEVLALAQRVLVVHAGAVRECAPDREVVGRAMLGVR
ncbi:MAG TPA: ATP-binding cassette domain-containing protein [Gemmatimonadaceae bacterium]|nr:ATP-binding cassette domain-containing protein [Gemmatimonadaceae bacterium]